jgi:hypothetical protein
VRDRDECARADATDYRSPRCALRSLRHVRARPQDVEEAKAMLREIRSVMQQRK